MKGRGSDVQDLLDALLSLITVIEAQKKGSRNDQNKNKILDWFSSLSLEERGCVLHITEEAFVKLLVQMVKAHNAAALSKAGLDRNRRKAVDDGVRFVVFNEHVDARGNGMSSLHKRRKDPQKKSKSLPFDCEDEPFVVRHGASKTTAWGDSLQPLIKEEVRLAWNMLIQNMLVFEDGGHRLVVVSLSFLQDVAMFEQVLTTASGNGFLRDIVKLENAQAIMGETSWFQGKGDYTLGEFIANKIELLLWRGWLNRQHSPSLLPPPHHHQLKKQHQKAISTSTTTAHAYVTRRNFIEKFFFRDLDQHSRVQCLVTCSCKAIHKVLIQKRDCSPVGGYHSYIDQVQSTLSCIDIFAGLSKMDKNRAGVLGAGDLPMNGRILDFICTTPLIKSSSIDCQIQNQLLYHVMEKKTQWYEQDLLDSLTDRKGMVASSTNGSSSLCRHPPAQVVNASAKKKRRKSSKRRSNQCPSAAVVDEHKDSSISKEYRRNGKSSHVSPSGEGQSTYDLPPNDKGNMRDSEHGASNLVKDLHVHSFGQNGGDNSDDVIAGMHAEGRCVEEHVDCHIEGMERSAVDGDFVSKRPQQIVDESSNDCEHLQCNIQQHDDPLETPARSRSCSPSTLVAKRDIGRNTGREEGDTDDQQVFKMTKCHVCGEPPYISTNDSASQTEEAVEVRRGKADTPCIFTNDSATQMEEAVEERREEEAEGAKVGLADSDVVVIDEGKGTAEGIDPRLSKGEVASSPLQMTIAAEGDVEEQDRLIYFSEESHGDSVVDDLTTSPESRNAYAWKDQGPIEESAALKDLCLKLEAEVATLRGILATQRQVPQQQTLAAAAAGIGGAYGQISTTSSLNGVHDIFIPSRGGGYAYPNQMQSRHDYHHAQHMEIMSDDGRGGGLPSHPHVRSAFPIPVRGIPALGRTGSVTDLSNRANGVTTGLDQRAVPPAMERRQEMFHARPNRKLSLDERVEGHSSTSLRTVVPHHQSEEANPHPSSPFHEEDEEEEVSALFACSGFNLRGPLVQIRSRLCDDVALFVESVSHMSACRLPHQTAAINRCRQVVQALWPRAQVKSYGSFVTGLALPSSDVDLVICLPKVRKDAPAEAPGVLEGRNAIKETWQQELARRLRTAAWVDQGSIKIISHTAIPVIKLKVRKGAAVASASHRPPPTYCPPPSSSDHHPKSQHDASIGIEVSHSMAADVGNGKGGPFNVLQNHSDNDVVDNARVDVWPEVVHHQDIHLDVSIEGSQHSGLLANRIVSDLIRENPAVRPLVLVLKQFMKERGLIESYSGGLSSYGLVLMVARYLQEQSHTMDTGSLLLGFLDFYSNHFDPRTTGISTNRRCYFSRDHHPVTVAPSSTAITLLHRSNSNARAGSLGGVGSTSGFYNNIASSTTSSPSSISSQRDKCLLENPYRFDPLYIEDPMCPGNNVGRNCFRIFQIQRAWSDAWRVLDDAISGGSSGEEDKGGNHHQDGRKKTWHLLGGILAFCVPKDR